MEISLKYRSVLCCKRSGFCTVETMALGAGHGSFRRVCSWSKNGSFQISIVLRSSIFLRVNFQLAHFSPFLTEKVRNF